MDNLINRNLEKTYCNPLSLPDIPSGKDDWYRFETAMFSHETPPDGMGGPYYRSISDPTVYYYGGKWFLYPSYGMAWVSEDFYNWKHVRTEPYCGKYSPCITKWGDKFLLTSWNCPLYVGDNPLGPFTLLGSFILPDGTEFVPCDPCIFTDDDGRIYMYACNAVYKEGMENHIGQIVGWELDTADPRKVLRGPEVIMEMDPESKPWERHGYHNQDKDFGWVEGPHLLKHNGRYYMIYAAPDTCDASYCMAVYYSDKEPLSGFKCQKRNPLTVHRHGIVGGAGHGCVEHGPGNTLWAFYTIAANYLHMYERRIGMDLVAVDENGELYCPHGVTDTPQYAPGVCADPVNGVFRPQLLSLTGKVRPTVSSAKEGRDGLYATDESALTFWEPDINDKTPTLICDLSATFYAAAVRIFWRENGLDYSGGVLPGPIGWLLEGLDGGEWITLADNRNPAEEKNIDYKVFPIKKCSSVRLTITDHPRGIHPGIIDFAVFGIKHKEDILIP